MFNGFLCPLLALLTDWDVPPIRNTRRIIALLMFLNGFALERKYLTRSQNCSRAHTTGIYVLMDSPSINVRERKKKKQLNIWFPSSTKKQLQLMVAQICQLQHRSLIDSRYQNKRHNVLNVRICSTMKYYSKGEKKIIKISFTDSV